MKTVVCDICGRTQNQLRLEMTDIYHFEKVRMVGWMKKNEEEFDICTKCLKLIRKAREEESDR